jgi:hypothetical protein
VYRYIATVPWTENEFSDLMLYKKDTFNSITIANKIQMEKKLHVAAWKAHD